MLCFPDIYLCFDQHLLMLQQDTGIIIGEMIDECFPLGVQLELRVWRYLNCQSGNLDSGPPEFPRTILGLTLFSKNMTSSLHVCISAGFNVSL